MFLSFQAAEYVRTNGLRSFMIASNCRRFERVMQVQQCSDIKSEMLAAFRERCRASCLSPVTIEKTITDVCTVIKFATGVTFSPGKRLRRPKPKPKPVALETINAAYLHATPWLQQWLALTLWTGLRLRDSLRLQLSLPTSDPVLYWEASKTGYVHQYPVPAWLSEIISVRHKLPYQHAEGWTAKILKQHLQAACLAAGVTYFHPKLMRQRSVNEWSNANATAGSLIHGSGIGVLQHYLDPLTVLQAAAPRVAVPAAMLGNHKPGGAEETLLTNFRRLDPQAQNLISDTAERLVAK